MDLEPGALRDFYRRYLQCCNERRFDQLAEFVRPDVRINGAPGSLEEYIAGLRAMLEPFPDYRWQLQQLVIEGDRLAARFNDTGIHAGRPIPTTEFSMYRVDDGRIAEFWGVWITEGTSVLTQLADS
jgi:predicted ester cyclase